MADLFESAKAVWKWANEDIEEFYAAQQAFFHDNPARQFHELDHATGESVVGFYLAKEIPDGLRKHVYHIINDLRNALDQATHAASCAVGTEQPNRTNFPSAEREDLVRGRLNPRKADGNPAKNTFSGIPADLHDKLVELAAYPVAEAANHPKNMLFWLVTWANPNKHRIALRSGFQPSNLAIRTMTPNVRVGMRWDSDNSKAEVARFYANTDVEFDAQLRSDIVFAEAGDLTGKPVFRTLCILCNIVQEIIRDLEADAARVVADRG